VEISFTSWLYTENDTLPFVIPTEAKRSGGICSFT